MRVGYDAGPWIDLRTGVGRYSWELARALTAVGAELIPFAVALRGRTPPGVRRWRLPARALQIGWRRWDRPAITGLSGPVDLVHATNFVLPSVGATPGVVTVHDLSFLRADTFPGGRRLRDLVPWSVRRARLVLTPTEAIAAEVRDRFGLAETSVRATSEGVSALFFGATPLAGEALAAMGIRSPFVLAVGTIEPRKNLVRLLRAWEVARIRLEGWTLVLAGPEGWGPTLPEATDVVMAGWVGDETLPGLLAAAEFFCYPSLYEGFGLPPLEAMATGTAVVAGDVPAVREVLGDAALLVDPLDVDALADAIAELGTDEGVRGRMARAGRARAARYTWEEAARATLAAYTAALS